MKIATWNVNGIRARQGQLLDWLAAEKPDIVCLQEIKASLDQLPFELRDVDRLLELLARREGLLRASPCWSRSRWSARLPACSHPAFDFEQRIACATVPSPLGDIMLASIYVPNGGKDFEAKMRFLDALEAFVGRGRARSASCVILCGDLNVARAERDIHPKLRKPNQIGARPDERALLERLISHGLVDVSRTFEPDNDNLFTWWAPWRNHEGAQHRLADRLRARVERARRARHVSRSCRREIGTSDHGPVVVIV